MENFREHLAKSPKCGFFAAFTLVMTAFSANISANQTEQTLLLIGGALTTCSSLSPKNCIEKTSLIGKKANQFQLTGKALQEIKSQWPDDSTNNRNETLRVLSKIAKQQPNLIDKGSLLWAWRDLDSRSLNNLTDREYNFVTDMLEVAVVDAKGQRIKETVQSKQNNEPAANDIVNFISATAKVNSKQPSLLAITASSRDPYESADFYEGLLDFDRIKSSWLALTPALAQAITTGQCEKLAQFRQQNMQVFNRHKIYPDRIQAEQQLCDAGVDNLVAKIESATGIMLNGGDQSLTRKVLFDDTGKPYPWTDAIRSRPLLVGTSAGTAIQSGGSNQFGSVAMITNGTSLAALRDGAHAVSAPSERCEDDCNQGLSADTLTYQTNGGLGSFSAGIVDTHFSERNRTVRLATLLAKTGQQYGFGVDETTALVFIKSQQSTIVTVLGKHGVVHLNKGKDKYSFDYSFWPAGAIIDVTPQGYQLNQRTIDSALPAIKIPPLPMQRFNNILTDAKLRSLTQAMCLANEQSAVGQQDEFIVTLNASKNTQYQRISPSSYGCAIERLSVNITTIQ